MLPLLTPAAVPFMMGVDAAAAPMTCQRGALRRNSREKMPVSLQGPQRAAIARMVAGTSALGQVTSLARPSVARLIALSSIPRSDWPIITMASVSSLSTGPT
jgi:hypothetical protein